MESLEDLVRQTFIQRFGESPTIVGRAPGRVELLGNHTDYNGGLVLASAIDRFTAVAARTSRGSECRVHTTAVDQEVSFSATSHDESAQGSWHRYVRAVLLAMSERFGAARSGFDATIVGDIPIGAGLSSSASLEAALGLVFLGLGIFEGSDWDEVSNREASRMDLAFILKRAENEFVGVASGLLDQFSTLFGRADHALMLDCRDGTHHILPLGNPAPAIVVCDTKTSRRLADGMYNRRRAETDRALATFRARKGQDAVAWLRDVTLDDLQEAENELDPVTRRRVRHVLTENVRVERGVEALRLGDAAALGRLMSESHASSRDDFENSSSALDTMIEAAESSPGFLGGKLSGAGWAGCTVNLVLADQAQAFADSVRQGYRTKTGTEPTVYVCRAADGASTT